MTETEAQVSMATSISTLALFMLTVTKRGVPVTWYMEWSSSSSFIMWVRHRRRNQGALGALAFTKFASAHRNLVFHNRNVFC